MNVTVHALFSKNNLIGSKIICKGTKHLAKGLPECSHTALLVNNRWVHESTGHTGVRVISIDSWSTVNVEVARIKLPDMDYQELADHFRKIKGKKYDYLGVLFLGLDIGLTFLGCNLDRVNQWESDDKYFCCEVLGKLTQRYYGMHSPIQILRDLCSSSKI